MIILEDIINFLKNRFPEELQESWDNVGLMAGDESLEINKALICLDVTSDVVKEAIDFGADLIISHHPLIFSPLKNITEDGAVGSMLLQLIKNGIAVYSMHTNFDKADGGLNDILSEKLGLINVRKYKEEELMGRDGKNVDNIGRVGMLEFPMAFDDFADFVKASLDCRAMKVFGSGEETVQTIAICSGGGGNMLPAAYNSGADVYLSGDLGHHHAQTAAEMGLNLIDAGHFETENIICDFLYDLLGMEFPDLLIKKSDVEPYWRNV